MSVESIAIALHHSQAKGTAKIVLIGIANHDGDGGAWPSVATLAHYAGVDARNVQRALDKLVGLGEIRREVQAGGDQRVPDHRRPNRYHFLLRCPHNCDRTRQHKTRHHALVDLEMEGVAQTSPGGDSATGGVAQTSPKPSTKPTTTDDALERRVSNRASESRWAEDRCPGNWMDGTHQLGKFRKCIHCHEAPVSA